MFSLPLWLAHSCDAHLYHYYSHDNLDTFQTHSQHTTITAR